MSFGLALAGGGTRGAAHVGVLLALEEIGIRPTSIAGASAGSIVAGLYASGISAIKLKEIVIELSKSSFRFLDPDYKNLISSIGQFLTHRPVKLSGLLKGDKMEQYLCDLTGAKTIRDVNMKTVIPCVDLNSGLTIAYTNTLVGTKPINRVQWNTDILLCEAMRASSAVPAVFQPKVMGTMCLVDGGVTDVLPVNLLIAAGEKNVLAVDVSQNYKIPEGTNIFEVASHSLSIMQGCLRDYISYGEKLVLKPSLPDDSGLLTFHQMVACMDAGYDATMKMLPTIKKLFA